MAHFHKDDPLETPVRFGPAHFPVGTQFRVDKMVDSAQQVFTVQSVHKNGARSYVLDTGVPISTSSPDMNHVFNISWVREIVRRGDGPVYRMGVFEPARLSKLKMPDADEVAKLTSKVRAVGRRPTRNHYVIHGWDTDACRALLFHVLGHAPIVDYERMRTMLMSVHPEWSVTTHTWHDLRGRLANEYVLLLPKQRFKRWVRQNINRFLTNMHAEEKEEEKFYQDDGYSTFECDEDAMIIEAARREELFEGE